MAHIKSIGLENFRVFKEMTEFDLAPVTLLTGANNSGKSSFIKGLLLFAENLAKPDITELNFNTIFPLRLGNFENCLNNTSDKKEITFSYSVDIELDNKLKTLNVNHVYNLKDKQAFLKELFVVSEEETLLRFRFKNQKEFNISLSIEEDAQLINSEYLFASNPNLTTTEINKINEDLGLSLKNGFDLKFKSDSTFRDISNFESNMFEFCTNMFLKEHELFISEDPTDDIEEIYTISLKYTEKYKKYARNFNLIYKVAFKDYLKITYLPSVKVIHNRIYLNENQGTSFNELIYEFAKLTDNAKIEFVNKWLKEFEIGDKANFYTYHFGTEIRIEKNGKEINLADLGFGIADLLAILLKIVTSKAEFLAIEEPEVNLHPNWQSKLAELFIDTYRTFGMHLIIETHSEYLIRKFLYLAADKTVKEPYDFKPENIAIYNFYHPEKVPQGKKQVSRLAIQADGSLNEDFGSGFLDEADRLAIDLYDLKKEDGNVQ